MTRGIIVIYSHDDTGERMKGFIFRLFKMIIGLMLFATGCVFTIKANIGYAPWDVFHVGLSNTFGFSIGLASIIVGLTIGITVMLLGEKIGLGLVSNMILVGVFVDLLLFIGIIQTPQTFIFSILMMIVGLFIISIGTYFYIGSAFGAGPRDSFMVVLKRRMKIPVGVCRSIVELLATLIGWALGGMVGIGTVIFVIGIGFCMQITFKVLRFDVTSIKHESFVDTFKSLKVR